MVAHVPAAMNQDCGLLFGNGWFIAFCVRYLLKLSPPSFGLLSSAAASIGLQESSSVAHGDITIDPAS